MLPSPCFPGSASSLWYRGDVLYNTSFFTLCQALFEINFKYFSFRTYGVFNFLPLPLRFLQKKRTDSNESVLFSGIRQRPTLPGRLQPSTIGAEGLNFCVRYGYRWFPFAIATGISRIRPPLRSRSASVSHPENCTSSFPTSRFAINQSLLYLLASIFSDLQDPWIKSSTD